MTEQIYSYECEVYEDYDDFGLDSWGKCGGGSGRAQKREGKRCGGKSNGVYSTKHTRLRDARKNNGVGAKVGAVKTSQNLNRYKLEQRWKK